MLVALAHAKKSYGYRRLWALLTRRGWKVNLKRVHRLYREEKLMARRLKRKRIVGVAPLAAHLSGPPVGIGNRTTVLAGKGSLPAAP